MLIMGVLLVYTAIQMYRKDTGLDLKQTTRVSGRIVRVFDTTRVTDNEMLDDHHILGFQLDNVPQLLGEFNSSQDYTALKKVLVPGTEVTVYYKPNRFNEVNLDVYQLEQGNQVILDYKDYEKTSWFVILIIGLLGVGLLAGVAGRLWQKAGV